MPRSTLGGEVRFRWLMRQQPALAALLAFLVLPVACQPVGQDPTRLAGCYALSWYRGGVRQIGPLLPSTIRFRDLPAADEAPDEGSWYAVDPVELADSAQASFPVASWQGTYTLRGWSPVGQDSLVFRLQIPGGTRWNVELRSTVDSILGATWYVSGSDSDRVLVRGRRVLCPSS